MTVRVVGAAGITYQSRPMDAFEIIDDEHILPIPLDRETRRRLASMAREMDMPAARLAADLLAALLADDEDAHRPTN